MAITFETRVVIGRDVADVFAALTDVRRWPEWLIASGIRRVDVPGGAPLRPGSVLRIDQLAAGRASLIEARIVVLQPPIAFGLTGKDGDGITTEIEARCTPGGPGTALDWRLKISLPLRLRMFEGLAAPQVKRAAALDLEAFRRRLETVAAD
jgi:uncharacterized protein YndB with AHSA1/START domain